MVLSTSNARGLVECHEKAANILFFLGHFPDMACEARRRESRCEAVYALCGEIYIVNSMWETNTFDTINNFEISIDKARSVLELHLKRYRWRKVKQYI